MKAVLLIMLAGILIGYLVQGRKRIQEINEKLITFAIWGLLFLLGISVGLNKKIMYNLNTIGLQAFLLTIGAVVGSVLLASIVYHNYFREKNKKI